MCEWVFIQRESEQCRRAREAPACESEFAAAEERLTEDLRDIGARFEVVYRLSRETTAAQEKVKSAREAIERARKAKDDDAARGGGRAARCQADLDAAVKAKAAAIEAATAKLTEYIEAKKKYNKMKARRLNHGYSNIGAVIVGSMGQQGRKCEELTAKIGEARESIDKIIDGQEERSRAPPGTFGSPFND
jgi:hypothetical protein